MKKIKSPISSNIMSGVKGAVSRQFRDRLTRASYLSPIKGKDTQAKQWNRWTP